MLFEKLKNNVIIIIIIMTVIIINNNDDDDDDSEVLPIQENGLGSTQIDCYKSPHILQLCICFVILLDS